MLDTLTGWDMRPPVVVADAACDPHAHLRTALSERGLDYVLATVGSEVSAHPFEAEPVAPARNEAIGCRPQPRRRHPAPSVAALAAGLGQEAFTPSRGGTARAGSRAPASPPCVCAPPAKQSSAAVTQPPASPLPLGEPLLVGEALMLPEGLAEGLAEGVAACEGELGRPLEVREGGFAFTGGGATVVAGGRETGDLLRVAVGRGRRFPTTFRSRTPFRPGCVVTRSDEAGASVPRTPSSSGDGCSGVEAARGAVGWESTDAVVRPPRMVKAAAAKDRTAYFFNRDGRSYPSAGRSGPGGGDPARGDAEELGPPLKRTSGIAASAAGAASLRSLSCAMPGSYAPHSGQVTAPLSVRLHGMQ
ncbi:transposase [Streptomyces avermitilis]|uniref:transposase n=1 Tax=Streptomyces avermitilis TaxID=33903 RepID=UPI0033C2E082